MLTEKYLEDNILHTFSLSLRESTYTWSGKSWPAK